MESKLIVLFGAGVSIPAKIPSTSEITNLVLSGTSVYRHSDETYRVDSARPNQGREYVQAIISLLGQINVVIMNYYSSTGHVTNYEDLYYVVGQLNDNETREYDNPAVFPLADKIWTQTGGLNFSIPYGKVANWRMGELTGEATNYIRDIVWHSLSRQPFTLDYFSFFKNCIQSEDCKWIDIFTLNHDTLIEQYLASNAISVTDGFAPPSNNVRYWSPNLYGDHQKCPIRLFKLHGSVNWFRFHDVPSLSLGIPLNGDPWHTTNPQGELRWPTKGRPEILVGRFNKELEYTEPVYVDLQKCFLDSLADADRMLIAGYSFGDKAVNTRIISWINDTPDRRIVLIHPNLVSLRSSARPAIGSAIDSWITTNRLIIIPKPIENAEWQEIRDSFNK